VEGSSSVVLSEPLETINNSNLGAPTNLTNVTLVWNGTNWVYGTIALPIASASTLGGIKVGEGLSIDNNGILTTDVKSNDLSSINSFIGSLTNKKLWGQNFNGTNDVKGNLDYVDCIELFGDGNNNENQRNGGYLDFHFNGKVNNYPRPNSNDPTTDFTARIIEQPESVL